MPPPETPLPQDDAHSGRPLITVLIPTRNRRHRVGPLVRNLVSNWPREHRDLVEIVVLNNASTDGTKATLEAVGSDLVRVVNREDFQPTSEENIFTGIQHARGEYIWFLGDDDVPRLEGLRRLIDLTRADAADFFVFNFRVMDDQGKIASISQIRGAPSDYNGPLTEIIKRVGLINMLSGWSILVARRSMLDVPTAYAIRDVSPIYSHCFWFLKCFKDARCRFVSTPLVDYRVFHNKGGWSKYTKEKGVGYLYYWHLGLLRLYDWSMENGVLEPEDISKIYEYRHNGTKYRGIDEIAFKLIEQAESYISFKSRRELMSREDLSAAIDILMKIDLSLLDVCLKIEKLYETLWGKSIANEENINKYNSAKEDATELLWSRNSDLFNPYYRELIYGYSVYFYNEAWIGIRYDAMSLIDAIFSHVLPRAMEPGVLVCRTREQLLRRIGEMPEVPEPVGDRPELEDVSMFQNPITAGSSVHTKDGQTGPVKALDDWEAMIAERDDRVQELTAMVGARDEIAIRLNNALVARERELAELKRGGVWGLGRAVYRRLRPKPAPQPAANEEPTGIMASALISPQISPKPAPVTAGAKGAATLATGKSPQGLAPPDSPV